MNNSQPASHGVIERGRRRAALSRWVAADYGTPVVDRWAWVEASEDSFMADGHGRCSRSRGDGGSGCGSVPCAAAGARLALSRADEQLDLHPPGPGREAGQQRPRCPRGSDLDVCDGDRGLSWQSTAEGHSLRDRGGGPDDRAPRQRVHADRPRPGLCRARRDSHL